MLEIKNLTKTFNKNIAIDNFSFTFNNNVYALLGPNGAGKTSLLRSIVGLYPSKENSIIYNDFSSSKSKKTFSKIGYLPQDFALFKELKVKEVMQLLSNLKGLDRTSSEKEISNVLELVDMSDRLNSRIRTLSGGMVRRIGIAQALLGNPDIILFDEPTVGLDPEERLRFKNIISSIKKDKTIIISTHIVDDADSLCENILIMDKGKLKKSGTVEEIKSVAREKAFILNESAVDSIRGSYILQKKFAYDEKVMMKILSSNSQNLEKASIDLEDGYICVLKNI
ncbi:MAG: ATP-binding cassette domain-containing protein [Clostridia bacterium]|nr:ATP-binding cassette domain-containing protein [Clostridia bacterium]MEE1137034.1 ATP-binding cassette domain-containing protein [Acutalibacteraceae bacterium]